MNEPVASAASNLYPPIPKIELEPGERERERKERKAVGCAIQMVI